MLTTQKDIAAIRDILQEARKQEMQSSQYK